MTQDDRAIEIDTAVLDPDSKGSGELLQFKRLDVLDGAEHMRAGYRRFTFGRHAHDRIGMSLITHGTMELCRPWGQTLVPAGGLIFCPHDSVHWGGLDETTGWRARNLYIPPSTFARAAEAHDVPADGTVMVTTEVITDPDLVTGFARLHAELERQGDTNPLAQEMGMFAWLSRVLGRYGDRTARGRRERGLPRAVTLARGYLDAHAQERVTLEDLSREAGMSRYRLARLFTESVGMPPHAYQTHRRVRMAEGLLRTGESLAETAFACGFTDQSHFTRVFKRLTGMPPGVFRAGAARAA